MDPRLLLLRPVNECAALCAVIWIGMLARYISRVGAKKVGASIVGVQKPAVF